MSRLAVFLLSALILVRSDSAATAESPTRGAHFEEGIELASSEAALEGDEATKQFDLFELRDLWVRVKVHRPPRLVTLKLTFSDPDGTPLYETTLLYTTDPKVHRGMINGAPASALQAKRIPGGVAFDHPVPIDGTVFQRYPKPGSWLVKAEIESTGTSLSTPLDVIYGDP